MWLCLSLHAPTFSAFYTSEQHPYITLVIFYNLDIHVYSVCMHWPHLVNPRCVGGGLQYFVGLCVCLLPQNCCLSSIISKSEHATALNLCKELAILLFYKTG